MMALLDPSKMENAVKVITQLDDKTTGLSLKVSRLKSVNILLQSRDSHFHSCVILTWKKQFQELLSQLKIQN